MCSTDVINILFVCYGNTCRSAMAKAVFLDLASKQNVELKFEVDSAGISGWQTGQESNDYVKIILNRNHIPFQHKARQITVADFKKFDYMLGMDLYNIRELDKIATALNSRTKVILLGDFNADSDDKIIMDPYFRDRKEDFEKCFVQITQSCEMLLKHLLKNN